MSARLSPSVGRRAAGALAAVLLAVTACAGAARAEVAPADTALQRWVRAVADSTGAYFGLSAQPADTAGLDSAQVYLLAHPGEGPRVRRSRLSLAPALGFNRAAGAMLGGSVSTGLGRRFGRVTGTLQWANGPDEWYGGGTYTLRRSRPSDEAGWTFRIDAGRRADALNRDHFDAAYATINAFVLGSDRHNYLRRDGVRAEFTRREAAWTATAGYRNELESPLVTTTFWTLTGAELEVVPNVAAAFGRASEARLHAAVKLPWAPFRIEGTAWNAGGALGGDLAYHRYRAALGGGIGLGRHFALAPQLEYARLTGAALPQDLLYLGGQYSLPTIDSQSLSGTGRAVGRVELLLQEDVLQVLGVRRNSAFPLQLGAFAASGARWGYDPATGVARPTPRDWPGREQWLSDAGVSVLYRPGLPDPETFIRLDYAWPLGPNDREAKLMLSYKRTLHLLGPR